MKLRTDTVYAATVDELWRTCSTRDYVESKYRSLGSRRLRIHHWLSTEALIEVELERAVTVDRDRLPFWMRRWVPEEQVIRHASRWHRTGELTVDIHMEIEPRHLPVRAEAEGSLCQRSTRSSRMALQWEVTAVLVPIVAGRAERQLASEVVQAMEDDQAFTRRYLSTMLHSDKHRRGKSGAESGGEPPRGRLSDQAAGRPSRTA